MLCRHPRGGPSESQMIRAKRVPVARRERLQTGDESIPFASTCPKCGRREPQLAFSRSALQRSLDESHPVEAYCAMCDVYWQLTPHERAEIAARMRG
jgi:hypothetical protein